MNELVQGAELFLLSCIILFFVGAGSLEYYAAIWTPSEESLKIFLNHLKFPLTIFYVNARYNLFTGQSSMPVVKHLQNPSLSRAWSNRIGMSLINLISLALLLVLLKDSKSMLAAVIYGFWLVLSLTLFYLSWHFGHKLKEIDQRLQDHK